VKRYTFLLPLFTILFRERRIKNPVIGMDVRGREISYLVRKTPLKGLSRAYTSADFPLLPKIREFSAAPVVKHVTTISPLTGWALKKKYILKTD
jgi:hypothetical protein